MDESRTHQVGPVIDGLKREMAPAATPRRIVSLVPSLTEALFAFGVDDAVVGVTNYCVEPPRALRDKVNVGGTKTPDLSLIRSLRPDLVIASAEENIKEHIESLINEGVTVFVSLVVTVDEALDELAAIARLTMAPPQRSRWLDDARRTLATTRAAAPGPPPLRYFCPIWRRPYMAAAAATYMSDLLRECGGESVCADGDARYFSVELKEALAARPALVLLPSEPYPFAERHRAEVLATGAAYGLRPEQVHLVDGQLLTWYGPRIGAALHTFGRLFAAMQRPASMADAAGVPL